MVLTLFETLEKQEKTLEVFKTRQQSKKQQLIRCLLMKLVGLGQDELSSQHAEPLASQQISTTSKFLASIFFSGTKKNE